MIAGYGGKCASRAVHEPSLQLHTCCGRAVWTLVVAMAPCSAGPAMSNQRQHSHAI